MSAHIDLTKLLVSLGTIGVAGLLCALGKLDAAATVGVITGVGGYILGNGRSVAAGDRPGTLLTRTDVRSRAADQEPSP